MEDIAITKPSVKKGDVVKLMVDGRELEGTVLGTTVVHFCREYHIQFPDGSKEWFKESILGCLKN